MRLFFRIFSLLALLIPSVAMADSVFSSLVNLQAPSSDVSIRYLGYIFGSVGTVLTGNGSQILGSMFRVFNSVVLALGAIVMMYILITSTLNTAQDGEVLGKKWSSMWIPTRAAMGVGLLIPQASGYSMIQVLVMWLVLQGVGAADSVWNSALNYLNAGGILVAVGQPPIGAVANVASQMLQQEICMYALQDAINKNADPSAVPIDFSSTVLSPLGAPNRGRAQYPANQDNYPGTISVPGIIYDANGVADRSYQGACGTVTWEPITTDDANKTAVQQQMQINAIVQIFSSVDSLAKAIVATSDVQNWLYNPDPPAAGLTLDEVTSNANAILTATSSYEAIMQPLMNSVTDRNTGFISDAESGGWAAAGQYYYDLATLNSQIGTDVQQAKPSASLRINEQLVSQVICGTDDPTACDFTQSLSSMLTGDNSLIQPYIQGQLSQTSSSTSHGTMDFSAGGNVGMSVLSNVLSVVFGGLSDIIMGMAELYDAKGSHVNPVFAISTLGGGLVVLAVESWILLTAALFALGAASVGSCMNPFFSMLNNAVIWFAPVLLAILAVLFTTGATMAYYLPLVPYILMVFAALGWMIGVVESLIAAPIVALGIAHPEGHDIFGKGEHAVMLILNIFIRPTLIIFGFVTAIIMSYVGIWFLNEGFGSALRVWGASIHGFAWLGAVIAIIIIYTGLALAIIHKSFAMIHLIPDQILRWIGGGQHQFGEGQGEEQVKGSFGGGMKAIGDSGGSTASEQGTYARQRAGQGGSVEGGKKGKEGLQVGSVDHSAGVQGPQPAPQGQGSTPSTSSTPPTTPPPTSTPPTSSTSGQTRPTKPLPTPPTRGGSGGNPS